MAVDPDKRPGKDQIGAAVPREKNKAAYYLNTSGAAAATATAAAETSAEAGRLLLPGEKTLIANGAQNTVTTINSKKTVTNDSQRTLLNGAPKTFPNDSALKISPNEGRKIVVNGDKKSFMNDSQKSVTSNHGQKSYNQGNKKTTANTTNSNNNSNALKTMTTTTTTTTFNNHHHLTTLDRSRHGGGKGVGGADVELDDTNDDNAKDEEDDYEVVPGERAKLTHEKIDVRPTKNIKMKQHLGVKHALPKTRLTNAILYENVSQGRHLQMKLAGLQHNKHRSLFSMDLNKRAFVAQQDRKRHKWKREDEVQIAGMNLPSFSPEGDNLQRGSSVGGRQRPSVETIYHMSGTDGRAESAEAGRKPLLPMMKVRRERTEIVSHQDKVFVTKLPSVVHVDQHKLHVHNVYCGKTLLDRGVPSRDERFRRLHTTLSPAILTREDGYPTENLTTKSRLAKYVSTSLAVSEPLLRDRASEARLMVASRGKPLAQGLGGGDLSVSFAPGRHRTHVIDYVTGERKKSVVGGGRGGGGQDIIDMFRSKDIKTLARSLTTDAAGMRVGVGAGEGGGGRRRTGR